MSTRQWNSHLLLLPLPFFLVFVGCCGIQNNKLVSRHDAPNGSIHDSTRLRDDISDNGDDDDDDDDRGEMRYTPEEVQKFEEALNRQCQCATPEYDKVEDLRRTPFEKTQLFKILRKIDDYSQINNISTGKYYIKYIGIFSPFFDNGLVKDGFIVNFLPKGSIIQKQLMECLSAGGELTINILAVIKSFSVENKSVILVLNPNDQLNIQAFPFPTEKQTDVLANYERYKTIVTPVIDLIKNVTYTENQATDRFGPAFISEIWLHVDDTDNFIRPNHEYLSYLLDNKEENAINKRKTYWYIYASSYYNLSRNHVPKLQWSGGDFQFWVDYTDFSVFKTIRGR